eukprot:GHVU01011654.1.p1 GENE.GHVU01011654.1~~GHVU01011654.1.p1  ORF type:complete len:154 (+),score=21.74 GHVU01011654.1:31-492(+)
MTAIKGIEVEADRIVSGISALRKLHEASPKKEAVNILEEGVETIRLQFMLRKIPHRFRPQPLQIQLPHPIYRESDVCLIVQDPQRAFKEVYFAPEKPVPAIKRVLGFDNIPKKFPKSKDKRELMSAYDLFLADRRVSYKISKRLGKTFVKGNR